MPWLRIGDDATTHPYMAKLLVATNLNHQEKNEAFGVLVQLASVSAGHLTDYLVEYGSLAQVAPGREREVLNVLKKAGLATEVEVDEHKAIRLVINDEKFVHAKRREEVEADRRRARDKRTPGLLAQVRVRDGDSCRWCAKSVSWSVRTGFRAATYDSLSSHKDSTVDTLVVACSPCNTKRGNGEQLKLLAPPTPERMIYGPETVEFVNRDKWCQDHGIHIEPTQPTLPFEEGQAAAATRQQQDEKAAAPEAAAAPDHRAAPRQAAPTSDEDEPAWLRQPSSDFVSRPTPAAAPEAAAARPGDEAAAATRQQQDEKAAAPDHRAAPRQAAPDAPEGGEDNEKVTKPGCVLGRPGDGPENVGSGRVGTGRDGSGREGSVRKRRRRGKRGGKNK
ncbi:MULTISPECIES: hypothetical protein [Corynebacterium]|uniref:HNH nuclease domain-containing protein n=1 Tax=Corynebacterium ihumii TaxID=1232427 RepID=A0ABY7UAH8_9CORY|nr:MULTISPECIES: hypothetical protein [Corynebacterium]WCZ33646.1 hypothetical protein CIHUM_00990 [Corynebacterium ihumii]